MWNSYVLSFRNVLEQPPSVPSELGVRIVKSNIWAMEGRCIAYPPRSSPELRFGGSVCVVNRSHTHR